MCEVDKSHLGRFVYKLQTLIVLQYVGPVAMQDELLSLNVFISWVTRFNQSLCCIVFSSVVYLTT